MAREARYTIPAGTKVEIRKLTTSDGPRVHLTRIELEFEDRSNTGYGGKIFYFTFQDWLIAVNADSVK